MPRNKEFDVHAVLEKVMELFWRQGYTATSMQDLVDHTGINRASLYATFGDKRALFISALKAYDTRVRRALLDDLEQRCEPKEAIRRLFLANSVQVEKKEQPGCFLTNTAIELAQHDAEIGEYVADAQKEIEAFFSRMIQKGQKEGTINAHLDENRTARVLLAVLLGVLVLVRSRPDKKLLDDIINSVIQNLE